jgi:hypothetical protein
LPFAAGFCRSVDSLKATHAANALGTPGTSERELDETDDPVELDWVVVPAMLDGDPVELDWVVAPAMLDGDPPELDWVAVLPVFDGDPPELDWVAARVLFDGDPEEPDWTAAPAVPDGDPVDGALCCTGALRSSLPGAG